MDVREAAKILVGRSVKPIRGPLYGVPMRKPEDMEETERNDEVEQQVRASMRTVEEVDAALNTLSVLTLEERIDIKTRMYNERKMVAGEVDATEERRMWEQRNATDSHLRDLLAAKGSSTE